MVIREGQEGIRLQEEGRGENFVLKERRVKSYMVIPMPTSTVVLMKVQTLKARIVCYAISNSIALANLYSEERKDVQCAQRSSMLLCYIHFLVAHCKTPSRLG